MPFKCRSIIILVATLCLSLLLPGLAMAEGPSMVATAGFDGYYKIGEWFPVTVTLTNEGRDLDGVVRVALPSAGKNSTFQREVQLPSRSKKTIRLYARTEDHLKSIDVVLAAGGNSLATVPVNLRPVAPRDRLIVTVGDRGGLGFLSNSIGLVRNLARPSLADFPDKGLGLSSVDVLVLNGAATGELSEPQRQAIADWIGAGGQLIVGTGADWQRSIEGLKPILPAEVTSLVSLTKISGIEDLGLTLIRPSGTFAAANMVPKANGRVTAVEGTIPLLVEGSLGLGMVTMSAIDLVSDPLRGWAGNEQFWATLLSPQAPSLSFGPPQRRMSAAALSGSLYNIPALDLPSAWWLALFLFVYAVVIGPVNYLILRRMDKREWAWVTIPVTTVVFAFATYALGLGAKGGEVILNSVSIIQIPNDGQRAKAETYFGIFSPSQRSYNVDLDEGTFVAPISQGGLPGSGDAEITEGPTVQIRHLSVNAWSMRGFVARSLVERPIQITASLSFRNDRLEGTIVHQSGPALDDATILFGSNFVPLGTISTGKTKTVSLATNYSSPMGPMPLANSLYLSGPPGQNRETARKQAVTDAAFGFDGIIGDRWNLSGAYLIGWLNDSPLKIRLQGQKTRVAATTLMVFPLDVQNQRGSYYLPAGTAKRKVSATGSTTLEYNPSGLYIRGGSATIHFQLPPYATGSTVTQLDLFCSSIDRTPNSRPPLVSLYNWRDRVWVPQDRLVNGKNSISDPALFVNESGLVEALVGADSSMSGIDLDLGVRGSRP